MDRSKVAAAGSLALALTLTLPGVATAAVQNERAITDIAWAQGSVYDPETGSLTAMQFVVGRSADFGPNMFIFSNTWTPCSDDDLIIESWFAEGPAAFDLSGNFQQAAVRAVLDLRTDHRDECTGERVRGWRPDAQITIDLVGFGDVIHEREMTFTRYPGTQMTNRQAVSSGRQAQGTITVDGSTLESELGRISTVNELYHATPSSIDLLAATASNALSERRSITYTESRWMMDDHDGAVTSSRDWAVGAYRSQQGETLVGVAGEDITFDEANGCVVIRWTDGLGPGVLSVGGRFARATASATIDLEVFTIDTCRGGYDVEVIPEVPVTIAATADGKVEQFARFVSVLIPSEFSSRSRVREETRYGDGFFQVGDQAFDGDWATIGRETKSSFENTPD